VAVVFQTLQVKQKCNRFFVGKVRMTFLFRHDQDIGGLNYNYTTIDFVAFTINIHSIASTAVVRSEIRNQIMQLI